MESSFAPFADRREAGERLAHALAQYRNTDAVVYALPRGGVVIGAEVARSLGAPLALVIPRKIGHPENPEYAIAAVSEEGDVVGDGEEQTVDPAWLAGEVARERDEARRRRIAYGSPRISASGKIAIIVDDGIATGLTMRAALLSVKREKPAAIVLAVPAAPRSVVDSLRLSGAEVIVLDESEPFLGAVGAYYADFPQVSDEEVVRLVGGFEG